MTAMAVHVRHAPYDTYVGRAVGRHGFKKSVWANPFQIERGETAEIVVRRYARYLLAAPSLLARLPELRSKVLGCWCLDPKHPDAWCHARLLAELSELNATEVWLRLHEIADEPTAMLR